MQSNETIANNEIHDRDLNIRLDEVGWALFGRFI